MKVVHAQAVRILKEYVDSGVPGFEKTEYTLGTADENGHADLELVGGHASPEAFAKAAGILAASPVAPAPTCLEAPAIAGLPNAGQYVTVSAGVWEEPDPVREGNPGTTPSGVTLRWLYDGNEDDPVVIPEGDPHGSRDLHVPMAAVGKTIVVRVTRGRTTVYSEPFGPIEGGLTEYTFPAQPVPDIDTVSADPGARRRSGASQTPKRPSSGAQTPSTATGGKPDVVVQEAGKPAGRASSDPDRPKESKKQALAKRGAEEKTPPPAADRTSE